MKRLLLILIGLSSALIGLGQTPTFNRDIAPIVYNHCTFCHRPGEIGPMALTNYAEVSTWANTIKYVTGEKIMPPWKADPEYNSFLGENFLTDDEISLIAQWVDGGTPEGDPADFTNPPTYPSGSALGTPDVVFSFTQSYKHTGNNQDGYRVFVLPTNFSEDKEVAAVELRPGNRKIVHHALISADTTGTGRANDAAEAGYGYNGFGGFGVQGAIDNLYPSYVPGQIPRFYPEGTGQIIPRGADMLIQMHYAPSPVDEWDSSSVNIFFVDRPLERQIDYRILLPLPGTITNPPFFIPANQVKTFHGVWQVPRDLSLISISPHMHLLGQSWEIMSIDPQGDTTNLISIPEWDFNWQGTYSFDRLIKVEQGSSIHAYATYDNTVNNPENPNNPPRFSTWGERTEDEMYFLPIAYVDYEPGDENIVLSDEEDRLFVGSNRLFDIYPNPAKEEIQARFKLSQSNRVGLGIYNVKGQLIKTIASDTPFGPGTHQMPVNTEGFVPGVYILKIQAKGFVDTQKFVIKP